MKKFIAILNIIIIVLFCISLFNMQAGAKNNKSSNWEKLNDYIYLDKSSITHTKYIISAWFKVYNSNENYLYDVDGIPVYYNLVKYDADCTSNALALMYIKSFDKQGKLLLDEPNNYDVCSGPSGVVNGEIYYNALCKYKKDGK